MSNEAKLVVRKENLPTRCEICHQMDLFDPETGVCSRCELVSARMAGESPTVAEMTDEIMQQRRIRLFRWLTLGGGILAGTFGLIGSHYCMFPDRSGPGELPGLGDIILGFILCLAAGLTLFFVVIWGSLWVAAKRRQAQSKKQIR